MKLETRTVPLSVNEVREAEDGGYLISGTAVPYNSLSVDLGGFREKFVPGAFSESLSEDGDVIATYNHDIRDTIGRTPETLTLIDSEKSLDYKITAPDLAVTRDLVERIRVKIVRGSSFTFSLEDPESDDHWEKTDDGMIRTVMRSRLHEVAPVVLNAYKATNVDAAKRSLADWIERSKPEFDQAAWLELAELRQRILNSEL